MPKHQNIIDSKDVIITYDYQTREFTLATLEGNVLEVGPSGRKLGKKAWAEGANSVRYHYDLGLDEI